MWAEKGACQRGRREAKRGKGRREGEEGGKKEEGGEGREVEEGGKEEEGGEGRWREVSCIFLTHLLIRDYLNLSFIFLSVSFGLSGFHSCCVLLLIEKCMKKGKHKKSTF